MLFTSSANQAVRDALRAVTSSVSQARKEATAKRLDFYHDSQLPHVQAQLDRLYADPSKFTPAFINIVRKITNTLAMTYLEPPKRAIEGSERDGEVFSEITGTTGLDSKMKLASRYTKLLKTILLRPVWRNGRMDLDLLTGNILDVETGDSPEDLRSVMITHYGTSERIEEVTYSLWTPSIWKLLDYRGREKKSEPNPYRILPFVPCWDGLPTDSFWQEWGGDLISLQEAINLKLTDLLYTLAFQGFGVGWTSGFSESQGGEISVGPGTMLQLPADGKVGFASTNAPIEEVVSAIDWLIKQAAVSNGLPASSLSTKSNDESGLSKIVGNRELDELRRDDIDRFRRYESQLFDLIRTVWNVHNPSRKISDKATLTLDFADPKPFLSEKEKAETWDRLMDLGVITAVDVALERNPDLETRENALAHLLQMQEERAQLEERII